MIVSKYDGFVQKLKSGYWMKGNDWQFDWYIDCFFVEAMSYHKNPIKIGYMEAVLGDEFLDFKYSDLIESEFKDFFKDVSKVKSLIEAQEKIIKNGLLEIKRLKKNEFRPQAYKAVQLDLSLLMASVSVIFDNLINLETDLISKNTGLDKVDISSYIIDNSNKTKLQESNNELVDIYNKNSEDIQSANFIYAKLPNNLKVIIDKHTVDYGWLNCGERGKTEWMQQDFLEQLKNIIRTKNSKASNDLLASINSAYRVALDNLISINRNDNVAADIQVELDYCFKKYIRKSLGGKYNINIIEQLTYEEIIEVLEGKTRLIDYSDRVANYNRVCWPEDGAVKQFYFNSGDAFSVLKKMLKERDSDGLNTISGLVACLGRAEGVVRIIKNNKDLQNFQKGEILVASMTQPSYVIVMSKASAIVTDVGGVTSHAAIISREFGIPCIVATKNATKILKDGDHVVVDAVNGLVTKV